VFLFCSFLVTAPSQNSSADFDVVHIKRRDFVPFGGSSASKNFKGFIFSQNWAARRTSSVNKSMNNFSTVIAIPAQINSIGAARRKKVYNRNDNTKSLFQRALFGKNPEWGFQAEKRR
jgi:hypothetical protein